MHATAAEPAKVESFTPMRREELGRMVRRVTAAAVAREAVDVSAEVGQLMGDLACRMILGCSTRDKFNLKSVINEARNLAGAFNLADYVPLLGALDLQVYFVIQLDLCNINVVRQIFSLRYI